MLNRPGPNDPAQRAARSAARAIALQIGLAAGILVLLMTAGVGVLFDRAQTRDIAATLQSVATSADDAVDPPSGVWLLVDRGGSVTTTASIPDPVRAAAAAVTAVPTPVSGPSSVTTTHGRSWPAWVSVRSGAVVVAVYDMTRHRQEEDRLVRVAALTGAVGVALAALIGLLAGRRAIRPLSEALRLQDQFIADASHELRTPLAVISTRAQLLRRRLPPDFSGAVRRDVDQLVTDTRAVGDVVSELLQAAQLGHQPQTAVRIDLADVAAEVVTSMAPYAADRGVCLVQDRSTSGTVRAAPSGLRRAVVALVDNAIAHSPAGADIEVGVTADASTVALTVVDHGQGVDPAEVSTLTGRFRRGKTTAEADAGEQRFGLGLALVTQVVQSHGGRLEITDTAGGGATFTIVLPLAGPPGR